MHETRISSCKIFSLKSLSHEKYKGVAIYDAFLQNTFDFTLKRIFYQYEIPQSMSRGAHAHKKCHQILISVKGSLDVIVDDSFQQVTYSLNSPLLGLYLPAGLWASQTNFAEGTICIVLASENYDEDDYFRFYGDFLKYKNK